MNLTPQLFDLPPSPSSERLDQCAGLSVQSGRNGVSIKNIRPATDAEWDSIWQNCGYSTYFHSREWAEIWSVYAKGKSKPSPLLITFSDRSDALLPISRQKSHKGIVTTCLSSPAGTFGGWISTHTLQHEHAILLSDFLTKKLGDLSWRVNPYDPLAHSAALAATHDDETQVFDLRPGFAAVSGSWAKVHASPLRKARREGVTTRLAQDIKDWREYYSAYEDSLRRWAEKTTSRYSWDLFYDIFRRNSPNVKLWVASYQRQIIAGALCFYAPRHVDYWHGAGFARYFSVRPVDLLINEMVKDACERGFDWFDFNPSGGHEGVRAFKRRFGAISLPAPVFLRVGRLTRMATLAAKWAGRIRA